MLSRTHFAFCMLWSSSRFALLILFATSSKEGAQLPTDDLALSGSDSTDQSSLTDWFWQDTGINWNVLDVGNADMFSPGPDLGLDFADASGSDLSGYSLFPIDQPGVIQALSDETDLDLISLNQELASEEECLGDGVGMLHKRGACSVDLSKVQGRDPGLCPKFMNNIKITTCCCENAVEYDPETYPDFKPCYLCTSDCTLT